jgi:hypothetical protein
MDARTKSRYPEIYARWKRDPEAFWTEAAQAIDWYETPCTIFDAKAGIELEPDRFAEIARRLNRPAGEVELILALRTHGAELVGDAITEDNILSASFARAAS